MIKIFDRNLNTDILEFSKVAGKNVRFSNKKFALLMILSLLMSLLILAFTINNQSFYLTTIGKIEKVSESPAFAKTGEFGAEEVYYSQDILVKIENGSEKGERVRISHSYGSSLVYDDKYAQGMQVFMEKAADSENYSITGVKRDYFVVAISLLLFNLLLAVGGSQGALTLISLLVNILIFSAMLLAHTSGSSIIVLSICASLFFCGSILIFINGFNKISLLALGSTLATIVFTTSLGALAISLNPDIDYEFLEYLIHPYHQDYANRLFLAEILMGGTGVIIDISVAITTCAVEILERNPGIDKSSLLSACKNLGEDITGTMINVVFFTNVAACIPLFVISLRNGISFLTILRYNVFFETCRFLAGSIGILSAIPFSIFAVYMYYKTQGGEKI